MPRPCPTASQERTKCRVPPSVFAGKEKRPAGRHTFHGSIRTCCCDSVAFHCWTVDFCLECAWVGFQCHATEQPNYEYVCRLRSLLLLEFSERGQTQSGSEKSPQRGLQAVRQTAQRKQHMHGNTFANHRVQ